MSYRALTANSVTLKQPDRFRVEVCDGYDSVHWWAPRTQAATLVEILLALCSAGFGIGFSACLSYIFFAIFEEAGWRVLFIPELFVITWLLILAGFGLAGYAIYRAFRISWHWPQRICVRLGASEFPSAQWLRCADPDIQEHEIQWLRARWEQRFANA